MSKETQEIIIDLNNSNNATEQSLIPPSDILYTLLKERLNELETGKYECTDIKKYKKLKRHDSILIDGTRGAGKSTILKTLYKESEKDCKQKQNKLLEDFYILETLDPNQLDNKACFLSLIIDNIFEAAEIHKTDNLELFNEICNLKTKIDELSFKLYAKQYNDSNELSLTTKEERKLDETIHIFACKVAKLINKTILIQPIDDVDMELTHGTKILETIRKYLQTPRIIPIIALDSSQIYGMIKKEQFTNFGFKAKTPLSDITDDTQMEFLKKLPSEYIQKILPPSQTIVLDDMLEYYKRHVNKKDSLNIKFKYKSEEIGEIILDFTEILKLILNILYEFYDEEVLEDPEDFHIVNYLKNKTFRSFIDDARAVLNSLKKPKEINEQNLYEVDYKTIKNRFKPYHTFKSSSKHDAVVWFWEQYIKRLEQIKNKKLEITDITEDIIKVTPKDSENSLRKEKTYYRLIMQEFYLEKTEVIIESKSKITEIKKTIKMEGFIELILKTFFPAMFLETLLNNNEIKINKFPIYKLKEFSKIDKFYIINLYQYWLPRWLKLYGISNTYLFGLEIESSETDKFDELSYSNYQNKYFVHPFKHFIFLLELNNNKKNSEEENSNTKSFKHKLKNNLDLYINNYSYFSKKGEDLKSIFNDNQKNNFKSLSDKINFYQPLFEIKINLTNNSTFSIFNSLKFIKNSAFNFYLAFAHINDFQNNLKNMLSNIDLIDYELFKEFKNILIDKFNTTLKAIFVNNLILIFNNNKYFNKGLLFSGFKEKHYLLNYIHFDPLVENYNLINKNSSDENMIKNIELLFFYLDLHTYYNFQLSETTLLKDKLVKFYAYILEKNKKQIIQNNNDLKSLNCEKLYQDLLLKIDNVFSRKYIATNSNSKIYNKLLCKYLHLIDCDHNKIDELLIEQYKNANSSNKQIGTLKYKENNKDILENNYIKKLKTIEDEIKKELNSIFENNNANSENKLNKLKDKRNFLKKMNFIVNHLRNTYSQKDNLAEYLQNLFNDRINDLKTQCNNNKSLNNSK